MHDAPDDVFKVENDKKIRMINIQKQKIAKC